MNLKFSVRNPFLFFLWHQLLWSSFFWCTFHARMIRVVRSSRNRSVPLLWCFLKLFFVFFLYVELLLSSFFRNLITLLPYNYPITITLLLWIDYQTGHQFDVLLFLYFCAARSSHRFEFGAPHFVLPPDVEEFDFDGNTGTESIELPSSPMIKRKQSELEKWLAKNKKNRKTSTDESFDWKRNRNHEDLMSFETAPLPILFFKETSNNNTKLKPNQKQQFRFKIVWKWKISNRWIALSFI